MKTYHIETDNLAICLLNLLKFHQKIPEPRFGNDCIRGKNAHAVQLGRRVCLGGQVTPNNLILGETPCNIHQLATAVMQGVQVRY